MQDKEGKVAYLNKIVAVVGLAINQQVPAKPIKVMHPPRHDSSGTRQPVHNSKLQPVRLHLSHCCMLQLCNQAPAACQHTSLLITTATARQHRPTSISLPPPHFRSCLLGSCDCVHSKAPKLPAYSDSKFKVGLTAAVPLPCCATDCRWSGAREHQHLPADAGQGSTHGPCSRCCTGVCALTASSNSSLMHPYTLPQAFRVHVRVVLSSC
jgi:hypothetical protein